MAKINNPYILLSGGDEGVKPYHIIQTLVGEDGCTISITDYDPAVTTDNYLVAVYNTNGGQYIYILDEYLGGA